MSALVVNRYPRPTSRKKSSRQTAAQSPEHLREPIPFVSHPAFRRKNVEDVLKRLAPLPELDSTPHEETPPGLAFVAGFVSQPLLSAQEEQALFAWMNYHRFRAEQLRRRALVSKSPQMLLAHISVELERVNRLRNRIVSSNLRLVVSLAKKLAPSLDQMSDLISDGVLPLIRAVELFDLSLGNRFSTYATWAVRNQMLRTLKRAKSSASRFGQRQEFVPDELPAPSESDDQPPSNNSAREVRKLLARLPERERLVLEARFGLEGQPSGQSLAHVAKQVGLSKERVRQLVLKLLEELRNRFSDTNPSSGSDQPEF